jgi:hypothetical protein
MIAKFVDRQYEATAQFISEGVLALGMGIVPAAGPDLSSRPADAR